MILASALLAAVSAVTPPPPIPLPARDGTRELLLEGARLHESGAFDEAIAVFRRVLEIDPANPEALYEMALSTFAKGNYPEATEILGRVVASPATAPPEAWLLLGASRAMVGHWALAEETFRQGLAIRPGDAGLRYHLALSLSAQGRFDPAIEAFQGCLRDAPYRAEVWRAFGDALYDAGAKGRAFAAYARALTLDAEAPPSREAARRMWSMIFEGFDGGEVVRVKVPSGLRASSPSVAEATAMSMLAVLRHEEPWKERSDAAFFVYAFDTILKLVSSLQEGDPAAPFWDPFVLAYFEAMRDGGHLEALAYDIRVAAGDPDASTWRERNLAKLTAYRRSSDGWAVDRGSLPR